MSDEKIEKLLDKYIVTLAEKAAGEESAVECVAYAQAALNLAQTRMIYAHTHEDDIDLEINSWLSPEVARNAN